MNKINFKGLGPKMAGLAVGTVAAGFAQKGIAKLGLSGIMSNVALLAVGALGPDMLGQKSPIMTSAGDAVMVKAISGILTEYFPTLISGVDDVAGPYNDDIAGYAEGDYQMGDVDEQGIVSGGPYADETPGVNSL